MNIIFINLSINAKVIEICVRLNAMLDDIFNDNKNKHELLNMFKRIVNHNNEHMRFKMRKIE